MIFDFTPDFYMMDNLTSLTLRVPGQADVAIPKAINSTVDWSEADQADGNVLAGDRTWTWPIVSTPTKPALGAILIDVEGASWTILSVTKEPVVNTWVVRCRNLAIVYSLYNLATVLKATYTKSAASGEAIATWTTYLTGVRARFQPTGQDTQILADAEWSKNNYNVYLGGDIFNSVTPTGPASADYRLVDSAGRHYRITEYQRPTRIDALPIAVCVLITEGTEGGAISRVNSSSSGT
ncbi:MAG: hypothetical protein WCJ35_18460 [Planctomycetota bacterium]